MKLFNIVKISLSIVIINLFVVKVSLASSIVIPEGPHTYGFVSDTTLDAQSIIALGPYLTSASIPLAEQTASQTSIQWEFLLWDDINGQPNQVIANFGSFDPVGTNFVNFTGTPDSPIPVTAGERYYLGLSPIGGLTSDNFDAIFGQGQRQSGTGIDLYTEGNIWAIRPNEGFVIENSALFDLTMTVNFVPIPPALWLFVSGAIGLIGFARLKNK